MKLKQSRSIYTEKYRRGTYTTREAVLEIVQQVDILIELHSSNKHDDGTESVNITIKNIKV